MQAGPEDESVFYFWQLIKDLWEGRATASETDGWRIAPLLALYKNKGKYEELDNWRGIVLLDVTSKIFSALFEEKLREVTEAVLSDSEVGYRKERGGMDAIFLMRRMLEEVRTSIPQGDG